MYKRVSVIVATYRKKCLPNIINNYKRQTYSNKELIIIINNNNINSNYVIKYIKESNIKKYKVYKINENENLGKCLNFGIHKSTGEYWAKMDDDDYYGANYLIEGIYYLLSSSAFIVGKHKFKVLIPEKNNMYIRDPSRKSYTWTQTISGATLISKKKYFYKLQFDINAKVGVDGIYIKNCLNRKYKIFSTSENNFIVIRHVDVANHTWKKDIHTFLKRCIIIKNNKRLIKNILSKHVI